jgi:hypothetical protein
MTEIEAIVEPDSVGNGVSGNLWRLYVFIPDKAGQALHRFYQFRVVKLTVPSDLLEPPEEKRGQAYYSLLVNSKLAAILPPISSLSAPPGIPFTPLPGAQFRQPSTTPLLRHLAQPHPIPGCCTGISNRLTEGGYPVAYKCIGQYVATRQRRFEVSTC